MQKKKEKRANDGDQAGPVEWCSRALLLVTYRRQCGCYKGGDGGQGVKYHCGAALCERVPYRCRAPDSRQLMLLGAGLATSSCSCGCCECEAPRCATLHTGGRKGGGWMRVRKGSSTQEWCCSSSPALRRALRPCREHQPHCEPTLDGPLLIFARVHISQSDPKTTQHLLSQQ